MDLVAAIDLKSLKNIALKCKYSVLPIILVLLLVSGCTLSLGNGYVGVAATLRAPVETLGEPAYKSYNSGFQAKQVTAASTNINDDFVYQKLISQYHEWKGVPYELGGSDKKGIDCSGFIHTTFRSRLGVKIPRSTELQIQAGREVKQRQLQAGDLLFFNTGHKQRHAGIYLDNGRFLHASSSKGVTISRLSNVYWKDKFLMAVRIPI